jgi:aminobenzoyl-glutamate transport protein
MFRAGECATYGLTPIMAYFVIYLAFMELYSTDEHDGVLGNIKYIIPYSLGTTIMWLIIIILFYIIGIPLGIGAYPGL